MSDYLETDVLILGSGIAGATAALELADAGASVLVVTRAAQADTNTSGRRAASSTRVSMDAPDNGGGRFARRRRP